MTQPINSGAPLPVQGVTGGPGLNNGSASIDSGTGNIVLTPPGNAVEIKKAPSAFNVYEFFNSNVDNVRLTMQTATGGPEFIGVQAAPTSVARDLVIGTTGSLIFNSGGANRWTIASATGDLSASASQNIISVNGYMQCLRSIVNGISIWGGNAPPAAGLGVNGDFFLNSVGGALTTIYQKRSGAWVGIV